MANTNLTSDVILNESLRVLHQKLNFVTNIVTEYDDSFAESGAKIGNTLRIRNPIQYSVATGATMATGTGADSIGTSTTLTVNTQNHVPMRFTSNELTMDIDSFSERHIEPAMSVLAAKIESGAFNMIDEVANTVHAGTAVSFSEILQGRKKMVDGLAPASDRYAILDTQAHVDVADAIKGLYNDRGEVSKTYKEGTLGRISGMDFYENTLLPGHTTGAEAAGSNYLVNGASQGTTVSGTTNGLTGSLIVDTGTKTIKEGDVFTIAGVYDVHPETKDTLASLKQFTVLADATGAGTLSISPAIVVSGPYQNVSGYAADDAALTFAGAASTAYNQSLLFQKGFACFATADLVMPQGVDFSARNNMDGISMRIVRDYSIVKDQFLTRIDVLSGYKVLRPQLACKVLHT